MIHYVWLNEINEFWNHCYSIYHFEGVHTHIFLAYQAMAYYQIMIHCILHIVGDKWRHISVFFLPCLALHPSLVQLVSVVG
jgi:hypothetical protein